MPAAWRTCKPTRLHSIPEPLHLSFFCLDVHPHQEYSSFSPFRSQLKWYLSLSVSHLLRDLWPSHVLSGLHPMLSLLSLIELLQEKKEIEPFQGWDLHISLLTEEWSHWVTGSLGPKEGQASRRHPGAEQGSFQGATLYLPSAPTHLGQWIRRL